MIREAFDTSWKVVNELSRWIGYPLVRILFALNSIPWGRGWRLYGIPIIQKHRHSVMEFGDYLQLRSSVRSNPLAPQHPVFLTTWKAGAILSIGDHFGMTGGVICVAEETRIGNRVIVGANSSIVDTDFHPLDPARRREDTRAGKTAPVVIEDDVFIGMNVLILKGSHIGRASVVGAGSVVSGKFPQGVVIAGNPARIIRDL